MGREIDSLAKILADPENHSRSAEELAALILDRVYALAVAKAKAEIRDETRREIYDNDAAERRLAVVGQINFGPQEPRHTVVLGPFRASLKLTDEDRLEEVLKRPNTAAREAGQHLAWDSKTGTGSGRFMLAPAFMKPRDAWDFYRPARRVDLENIAESLARWQPGLWSEEFNA
ncbi:hypothetical protein [Streptomyces sp. NPDC010273]|uniref:hypothetical protein n=1 Tax=Streptomyces sp. NPDC010273 TaxID=3364829 RepID=UPI0036E4A532